MDLAGNPLAVMQTQQQGTGMLDPRVAEAYDQFKAAGDQRIQRMQEHEPQEASILRSALSALPMAAMGLFTGGAAIPAALAYATAAGAMDYSGDERRRKAWELQEADEIFNTRKAQLEGAESAFGSSSSSNSQMQPVKGARTWQVFDKRTGQMVDSGVPIYIPEEELSRYGKFAEDKYGKPLEQLNEAERNQALLDYNMSSKTSTNISATQDPRIIEGERVMNEAKQRGVDLPKLRVKYAEGAQYMGQSLNQLYALRELLEEAGPTGFTLGPFRALYADKVQELETGLLQQGWNQLKEIKMMGGGVGQLSEKEFERMVKAVGSLSHNFDANIATVDKEIKRLEQAYQNIQKRYEDPFADEGIPNYQQPRHTDFDAAKFLDGLESGAPEE
jgi:hypothetical protein